MSNMPRTTLDLDDGVLADLRRRSAADGRSLGRTASSLLARALREQEPPLPPLNWYSQDMGKPLVDLEDREAVRRVLDGDRS